MIHHIRVNAPGYISKVMSVAFNSNVRLDISLEHAEATDRVVAIAPPAMAIPPPTRSAPMSAAIVDLPPVARRAITPAVPTDMPAGSADVLYASGQHHDELHNYAAALAAFEKWLAEADATTLHRRDVEQSIARLRLLVGKVMITADAPCEIAIDDVVVGKTPLQESLLVNVNVGRRKITFLRAGHAVETRFVDVVAADTIQLKASLVHVDAVEAGSKPTRPIDTTSPYGGDP